MNLEEIAYKIFRKHIKPGDHVEIIGDVLGLRKGDIFKIDGFLENFMKRNDPRIKIKGCTYLCEGNYMQRFRRIDK